MSGMVGARVADSGATTPAIQSTGVGGRWRPESKVAAARSRDDRARELKGRRNVGRAPGFLIS